MIEEVNKVYDKNGEEAAEKVLIKYYSSKVEESLFFLKNNCEELLVRYNLIFKKHLKIIKKGDIMQVFLYF